MHRGRSRQRSDSSDELAVTLGLHRPSGASLGPPGRPFVCQGWFGPQAWLAPPRGLRSPWEALLSTRVLELGGRFPHAGRLPGHTRP